MLYTLPWGRWHRSPRPDLRIPSRRDQLLSASSLGQLARRMAFNCQASVLNSRFCWAIITRNLQQSNSSLNSIWWFWWITWISGWFQGKVSEYIFQWHTFTLTLTILTSLTFPPLFPLIDFFDFFHFSHFFLTKNKKKTRKNPSESRKMFSSFWECEQRN